MDQTLELVLKLGWWFKNIIYGSIASSWQLSFSFIPSYKKQETFVANR